MTRLLNFFAVFAFCLSTGAATAQFDNDGMMVEASLVSERQSIAPGERFHIALKQDITPGWHTYWRNPGDSGEATRLVLDLPEGWQVSELIWPAPKTYPLGPLTNYGYSDTVTLPLVITAPDDLGSGPITLQGEATWLVCEDICIPEDSDVSITLDVGNSVDDIAGSAAIAAALSAAPTPISSDLFSAVTKIDEGLAFTISGDIVSQIADGVQIFPYDSGLIDHAADQFVTNAGADLRLDVKNGYLARDGVSEAQMLLLSFYDASGARQVYELVAEPGPMINALAAPGGEAVINAIDDAVNAPQSSISFFQAALFALIGGLILNLMPCVFPVLSMKAITLVEKRGAERSEARLLGIIFAAGVIGTFLALGGLLLTLRVAGLPGIWGMQLQVPIVVISLALLMFLIGLNFLGVFEVGTSLQNVGSGVKDTGRRGAFFTGVLAVFVAAPCLAPFMTGALAFALAQPPLASLTVFAFLGLGLALPFLIVSFVPELLGFLPRPGPWMVRMRQVLAFPMFATAIWLVWVLVSQVGPDGVIWALLAFLAAGFAVWAFTIDGAIARISGFAGLVLTVGVLAMAARLEPVEIGTPAGGQWQAWSPDAVMDAQDAGRAVFVDFTAAWCVTCQVNKLGALSDGAVKASFADNNVALFRADFTNRDPMIAEELTRYNSPGVPLYLMFSPDEDTAEVLPSLLTPSIVIQSVEEAVN